MMCIVLYCDMHFVRFGKKKPVVSTYNEGGHRGGGGEPNQGAPGVSHRCLDASESAPAVLRGSTAVGLPSTNSVRVRGN